MKTCEFNKIYERAKKVNILTDEWFNFAGFFWINLTNIQHKKMVDLLLEQGAKPFRKGSCLWIKLNNGLELKVI